jgi:hypothetical protein
MNDKLAEMCEEFEKLAKFAAIKKKKPDPKAKVRSRGKCCLPAEHPLVKDKKDHYPINDMDQARNALARASGHSSVPDWFKGSLKQLVSIVAKKVHAEYPKIKMTSKSRKPGKG